MQTREMRQTSGERALAWLIVVLLHGGLVWLAKGTMRVVLPASQQAIQVFFIESATALAPTSATPAQNKAPTPPSNGSPQRDPIIAAQSPVAGHAAPATITPAGRPLSMVYIAQARLQAEAEARSPRNAAPADPFAHRAPALPGKPGERFRMQTPLSAADVVAGIGKLFGGPGYSADPCDDLARNIATLAIQGDSWQLRHDMEFEKNACRPQ
ncbi:MAG: hypothetical protein COW59_09150 [Lysobacterales bacterium CG17_big_fil_post_rev_8_21_14_2_50_64_11]|nr:MAG: hypothetical protein COW59_09150 [Xanthomonadales bacterium CG17_big_fil_post_rev_8_21_14_2_50_64_11]PIX60982.1 MAG: hypothetical protein COZ47_04340 [Xanthomonadales bacterium CG_4_10_14_3_um_filter_64_11]